MDWGIWWFVGLRFLGVEDRSLGKVGFLVSWVRRFLEIGDRSGR